MTPPARFATCSPQVSIGALTGAALGFLLALAHGAYPDQLIASLATLGALVGYRRSGATGRPLGDVALLGVLLALTAILAGWHLAQLPGAVAGGGASILINILALRLSTKR
jgi:hypothetical protein